MTQRYAERTRRRPAYATYKNRKKTLRQMRARGSIGPRRHQEMLAEARQRYFDDVAAPSLSLEAEVTGYEWCLEHYDRDEAAAVRAGDCHESCVGAKGPKCDCPCEGANHGIASGYVGYVYATKYQRTATDDALKPYKAALRRFCNNGEITENEREALVELMRRHLDAGRRLPKRCRAAIAYLRDDEDDWATT